MRQVHKRSNGLNKIFTSLSGIFAGHDLCNLLFGEVCVFALTLGSRLCCGVPCLVTRLLHAKPTTTIMNEMQEIKTWSNVAF
jgi:hypothetical protein